MYARSDLDHASWNLLRASIVAGRYTRCAAAGVKPVANARTIPRKTSPMQTSTQTSAASSSRPLRRRMAFALALALCGSPLFVGPSIAQAQRGFSALADEATEVQGSVLELAEPLFEDCGALPRNQRRACRTRVRNATRSLNSTNYLWTTAAGDHLRFDPYEPMGGGFRGYLRGFQEREGDHLIATRATEGGSLPEHTVAEGFSRVPAQAARPWVIQNTPERLLLRVIFHFGEPFTDGELHGVTLNIIAVQVFNDSTGGVLIDTTREEGPPQAPFPLDRRLRLWDSNGHAEAIWAAPDGRRFLFHVENQPLLTPPNSSAPVLHAWNGPARQSVVQFVAPCCNANVSVAPRDVETVMVIITERTPQGSTPGQGQVLLIRFVAARGAFEVVARWRGSNTETPPAWVTDPNAPLPDLHGASAP